VISVLLVEDDENDAILVERELQRGGEGQFVVQRAGTVADVRVATANRDFEVILLELDLPDSTGFETLHRVQACAGATPILITSGGGKSAAARGVRNLFTRAIVGKTVGDERDQFFDLSLDLLCIATFEGWFQQVNPAWTRCLGWTAEELISRPSIEFVHPEDREATLNSRSIIVSGKEQRGFQNRYLCKDGGVRWLAWAVHPLAESRRVFGVARDITELKKAEDRIAEQAALLDIAHEAIMVKDLLGKIIYWNKGATRTFGWTAEEATGRECLELLYKEPNDFYRALELLLSHGEWQGEVHKRTKDGRDLTVEMRWTLVRDKHNQPKAILSINSDISERKKIEAQFLRAQRLESIGTLAGGIAHDLNNILAPIMMAVQMLDEMVKGEDAQSLLETLRVSTQRGADLVKQVLSFARGVEGKRIVLDPAHILSEIGKIVRETFPKNIEVHLTRPKRSWQVEGDPTQLHQIVMNLCVNARDAMTNGGRLTISAENTELDEIYTEMNPEVRPGRYVLIEVSDTGTGIPAEIQERIFEPFFSTKEIGRGTGLGLSTTLAIVKSHGGFIDVHSQTGKGARFKVYLPATTEVDSCQETHTASPKLPLGNGELILVVDDEEPLREVTCRTLERFNYRFVAARNGAEAIAEYARQLGKVAVVVTDMAMPVMDGPATVHALRSIDPSVKIIGCSGHASNDSLAKVLGAGLHFLPKPFTAEALLKMLEQILTEGRRGPGLET
jgi:PAS domain S-box-containing protein